jgi:hypothetical protein
MEAFFFIRCDITLGLITSSRLPAIGPESTKITSECWHPAVPDGAKHGYVNCIKAGCR